ncbi:unnamed protein product [Brassica rapa subsp. narinosa]
MDARMALLKSGANHHGQMVQGNHQGGVSAALQQLQSQSQQTPEINFGASPRQLLVDPSTVYGQGILQSKLGMRNAGLNFGVGALPLKGWPLTGLSVCHSKPIQLTAVDSVNGYPSGNMQHVNNMPKGPMMYGSDGISGLASSANQLLQDDMEPFGDVGALEDNVESFLSQDDGDGGSIFSTLKRNPSERAETPKGFSFSEVSSI